MSERIPTTNEVRTAYCEDQTKRGATWDACVDEFDRWLYKEYAEHVDIGHAIAIAEIIKWIEENRSALELEPGNYIYRDHFNSESLIAFIKGEEK